MDPPGADKPVPVEVDQNKKEEPKDSNLSSAMEMDTLPEASTSSSTRVQTHDDDEQRRELFETLSRKLLGPDRVPRPGVISPSQLELGRSLLADVTMSSTGENEKWCEVLQNFSKFAEDSQDENVIETWIEFLQEEKKKKTQEETQSKEIDALKQRLETLQSEKTRLYEKLQGLMSRKSEMLQKQIQLEAEVAETGEEPSAPQEEPDKN